MIVSGVPERTPHHAAEILETALDILLQMDHLKNPETGLPLNIQIGKLIILYYFNSVCFNHRLLKGVHTGSVVSGVIGSKLPKYCLFGETVRVAFRMKLTGEVN
jgi:hypothetical protein